MLIKLLETLLSNAVTVTVLAVIVFALAKRIRQQRIVHGLWLVVLLKLITPALVVLPFAVTVDNTWLKLDHFSSLTSFVVGDPSVGTPSSDNAAGQLPNAEQVAASGNATLQLVDSHDTNSRNSADSELHSWSRFVVPLLIWVWLLGSCVYIVRLLIRYVQFCRFLRHNEQVDEALDRKSVV